MRHFWFFLFAIFSFNASAHADTPRAGIKRLSTCLGADRLMDCRSYITASSVELFDRFESYKLADCLPKSLEYVSEKTQRSHMAVRSRFQSGGKPHIARLLLVEEENQWKLDIPETLRSGLGENWETQLNATEQVFLLMRQQMGGNLNCAVLQNLAGTNGR